jgi:Copper amine oxidase N-terminal domain.
MNTTKNKFAATAIAALVGTSMLAGPMAGTALAQSERQKDKNTTRSLGIGLGAAAVLQALRGQGTSAVLLGAGAAYAGKKYEDARKAQAKENRNRQSYIPNAPITVSLNDDPVRFPDQKPALVADRVYVPLRGVLEEMGANVKWDAQNQVVTAVKGDKTVRLPAGGQATVNGDPVEMEAPAYLSNGRVMVPLRFFAETFGADVAWDSGDREVRIKSA